MILCQLCPLYVQFSQEVDRDRQTAGCPQDRKEILLNLIASLETREDKNKLEQALLTEDSQGANWQAGEEMSCSNNIVAVTLLFCSSTKFYRLQKKV